MFRTSAALLLAILLCAGQADADPPSPTSRAAMAQRVFRSIRAQQRRDLPRDEPIPFLQVAAEESPTPTLVLHATFCIDEVYTEMTLDARQLQRRGFTRVVCIDTSTPPMEHVFTVSGNELHRQRVER